MTATPACNHESKRYGTLDHDPTSRHIAQHSWPNIMLYHEPDSRNALITVPSDMVAEGGLMPLSFQRQCATPPNANPMLATYPLQ